MPEFTVPGELLGIEEEVLGDEQTFNENGEIFAAVSGEKKVDGREAHVVPKKSVRMLRKGDEVYGVVEDLYDTVALIVIGGENGNSRTAIGSSYAYLRISEIMKGYFVKSFREYLKIGDIVKARVIDIQNLGTYLTFSETQLGVVKAYCSLCRSDMKKNGPLFVCTECGNRETRKTAGETVMPAMEERRPSGGFGGGERRYGDRNGGPRRGPGGFRGPARR